VISRSGRAASEIVAANRGTSDVGEVGAHHHPQRVGLEGDLRRGAAADLAVDIEIQGRIGV
jgi:hypothetical protein